MRFCRLEGNLDNANEVDSVGPNQDKYPSPLLRVSLKGDIDETEDGEVAHDYLDDEQIEQKGFVDLGDD